jgi:hypothetical protein
MDTPTLVDEFRLPIAGELPTGRYRLLTGAYESDTVMPLVGPDREAWFELATTEVLDPPQTPP